MKKLVDKRQICGIVNHRINQKQQRNKYMELKKGKYWVGDPCYKYPSQKWSEFCDVYFKTGDGEIQTEYGNFFVCSTAYGDGYYSLKKNGVSVGGMGVDAGLLSVIPAHIIAKMENNTNMELGCFIDLTEDCEISHSGGDFEFGGFSVNTSGNGEEDEEDEGEEDEENARFDD